VGSLTFTDQTKVFDSVQPPVPMTKTLADLQVLVDGQAAPIHFVSPKQINYFIPWSTPSSGFADVIVLKPSTGQIIASTSLQMDVASPGLFTRDATGAGQIAAVIGTNDGKVWCNGPDAPPAGVCTGGFRGVAPGEELSLYGTGQGFISGAPADGDITPGALSTDKPRVFIDGVSKNGGYLDDSDVTYSGLGPFQIGVWQVNVRIPDTPIGPAPGVHAIILQHKGIFSILQGMKPTTIVVKAK
jgi:uncharacterized protein (TIGR03437 family)